MKNGELQGVVSGDWFGSVEKKIRCGTAILNNGVTSKKSRREKKLNTVNTR